MVNKDGDILVHCETAKVTRMCYTNWRVVKLISMHCRFVI